MRQELTDLAESFRGKSHYEVLGVSNHCSEQDLDEAYAELARRTHPDRFQRAEAAIHELAEELAALVQKAYETLKDPRLHQLYDLELRKGERALAREEEGRRALAAETEFQKGQDLVRQRSYEDALVCFGKAIEYNDEDGDYHAHYGWCLYLCHQDDSSMVQEAIEHVRRGVKLARESEKPYLFLGRLFKVVGQVEAAEINFTRAIQIQPESVEALRELRLINMRREKSKGLIGRFLRR